MFVIERERKTDPNFGLAKMYGRGCEDFVHPKQR